MQKELSNIAICSDEGQSSQKVLKIICISEVCRFLTNQIIHLHNCLLPSFYFILFWALVHYLKAVEAQTFDLLLHHYTGSS